MKNNIECKWLGGMAFESDINSHKIILDAKKEVGGENKGPSPKPLLLVGLAGCTGMDVISILKKMRVEPTYFNVSVDGELTEEHPKIYNKIHLVYTFKGENLPIDKIEKAINLSQERYCGVSEMLRKSSEITHEIILQ